MRIMIKQASVPTKDVWRFKRELSADFEVLRLLERQFNALDEICDCVIRVDTGVANMVDRQQGEVYEKMCSVAKRLSERLQEGRNILYYGGE